METKTPSERDLYAVLSNRSDRGYRDGYYDAFVYLSKELAVILPPDDYILFHRAFIQPVLAAYEPSNEES